MIWGGILLSSFQIGITTRIQQAAYRGAVVNHITSYIPDQYIGGVPLTSQLLLRRNQSSTVNARAMLSCYIVRTELGLT